MSDNLGLRLKITPTSVCQEQTEAAWRQAVCLDDRAEM